MTEELLLWFFYCLGKHLKEMGSVSFRSSLRRVFFILLTLLIYSSSVVVSCSKLSTLLMYCLISDWVSLWSIGAVFFSFGNLCCNSYSYYSSKSSMKNWLSANGSSIVSSLSAYIFYLHSNLIEVIWANIKRLVFMLSKRIKELWLSQV